MKSGFDLLKDSDLSKNRLRMLCRLHQKKYRLESEYVLVEGMRLLNQLCENNIDIEEIFCLPEAEEKYSCFRPKKITKCTAAELKKLTETQHPQEAAALVKKPSNLLGRWDFILYLDGINEPGNLGTIFRTASAFCLDGIVLSTNCCEVFNPKVIRASLGSVFTMPFKISNSGWLKEQKAQIVCSVLNGKESIYDIGKLSKPFILVIGSEAHGIAEEVYKLANKTVYIPMSKDMESLNAAVAVGILIYELKRQL